MRSKSRRKIPGRVAGTLVLSLFLSGMAGAAAVAQTGELQDLQDPAVESEFSGQRQGSPSGSAQSLGEPQDSVSSDSTSSGPQQSEGAPGESEESTGQGESSPTGPGSTEEPSVAGDHATHPLPKFGDQADTYHSPQHVETTPVEDPNTGEILSALSGITNWSSEMSPQLMLRSVLSAKAAISAKITPDSGDVRDTVPRLRIDLALPSTAAAGDVYSVNVALPWVLPLGPIEIKDANGLVFAVARGVTKTSQGFRNTTQIDITLSEEVEERANIEGFLEVPVSYYLRRSNQTNPIVVTHNGQELTRSGQWFIPGEGPGAKTAHANGAVVNGRPAIEPYIRVPFADIVAAGKWVVKSSNLGSGLSIDCAASFTSRSTNANGWIVGSYLPVVPDSGDCSEQSKSTTFTVTADELRKQLGVSVGDMVTFRTSFYAEQANTSYSVDLHTSVWNASTGMLFTLNAVSGNPGNAGAVHQSLKTTKTASVKGDSPSRPATLGDLVEYTITTEPTTGNTNAIEELRTSDRIPAGTRYISSSSGGTYDANTQTVTWGPRTLTSTGRFKDTLTVEVVQVSAPFELQNTVQNTAKNACTEQDSESICQATAKTPTAIPSFKLKKTASVLDSNNNGWTGDEGDQIEYRFVVINTGKLPFSSAMLTDDNLSLKDHQCLPKGKTLAPGQDEVCSGQFKHQISAKDVQAGSVKNTASLCLDPKFGLKCEKDTAQVPTVRPQFAFDKSVAKLLSADGKVLENQTVAKGDRIQFAFKMTNTGNVPITAASVTDPKLGAKNVPCLSSGQTIAPGETTDCVANAAYLYTVSDKDVTAGKVHNIATGSVPGLPDQKDETTTPVRPNPVPTELPKTGGVGKTGAIFLGASLVGAGGISLLSLRHHRKPKTD